MKPIQEILVLHHSHTDIGYTHPQPILWELQRRFIDIAIDLCEESAEWDEPSQLRWTCETTAPVMHWLERASEKQIERFANLIKEDRIAIGAMFLNLTPMYSAHQLVRTLQPIKILRERFGAPIRVGINHDINGLPWPLTQLLLDAGVDSFLMGINPTFGGAPSPRPRGFKWQGSDGRNLLVFNAETYQSFDRRLDLAKASVEAMRQGLESYLNRLEAQSYPYDFIYLSATVPGWGDNAPPNPNLLRLVRQWNSEGREPPIRIVTPETLMERLCRQDDLPTRSGDWTDWWNFGAGSTARECRINREAREMLKTTEVLGLAGARSSAETQKRLEEAYFNLNLFDEHSWGAYATICKPWLDEVVHQWYHKANYAYEARSLSRILYRDTLEKVAGNDDEGKFGLEGILFANSAPVPRKRFVRVPTAWLEGQWVHAVQIVQRLDSQKEFLEGDQYSVVGPIDLPAGGFAKIPIEELAVARPEDSLVGEEGRIESAHYRLLFDPKTGAITGLYDKERQWEVLDHDSPWPFFGFVRETLDEEKHPAHAPWFGREAIFAFENTAIFNDEPRWVPDWPAKREGTKNFLGYETEKDASGVSLVLRWEAPGVRDFEQRIELCADRKSVELKAFFYKEDIRTPESIYFALPCNLKTWKAHFDTAGLPVEFDTEQLEGSCRDWITAGQWASVHDETGSVIVACPDAPLFQIGDFHFGKAQTSIVKKPNPLLLLWPVNNYWHTNFPASQPGFVKLRYELTTGGSYDPVDATRFGMEAASPIEIHPILDCKRPESEAIVQIEGNDLILLYVESDPDGKGALILLANPNPKPANGRVRFPGKQIDRAFLANTFGEPLDPLRCENDAVTIRIKGRAIRRFRIAFAQ
jgi:hypothetical protein